MKVLLLFIFFNLLTGCDDITIEEPLDSYLQNSPQPIMEVLETEVPPGESYPQLILEPFVEKATLLEPLDVQGIYNTVASFVQALSGDIAISFKCLVSYETFSINGDEHFFGASLVKLPRLMRIAQLIHEGQLSWDDEIAYYPANVYFHGGTGILQGQLYIGQRLTVAELVYLAAVYSDNIAYWLLSHYTVPFDQRLPEIFTYFLHEEFDGNPTTANRMMRIMTQLWQQRENVFGYKRLIEYYTNTSFRYRLITEATDGYVAQVIGSNDGYFHAMGIFKAEQPFVLTVLTRGVEDATDVISEIAYLVW